MATVQPADALDEAPLKAGERYVLAHDDTHVWMTDRRRIAEYDTATERWITTELPRQGAEVDQVRAAPTRDGLALVLAYCDGPCQRMRENLETIEAYFLRSGTLERLPALAPRPEHFGEIRVSAAAGTEVVFRALGNDRGTWMITVSADGAKTELTSGGWHVVCNTAAGFFAVEAVPIGTIGSVPPPPPPPNTSGLELTTALAVETGPSTSELTPIPLPDGPADVLREPWAFGTACLPDGIALLRADTAWELHGQHWQQAEAELTSSVIYNEAESVTELPDGTLVVGGVQRDPDGAWRAHDPQEQVFILDGHVLRHRFGD